MSLFAAAKAAGVRHAVLISFPPVDIEFPLQSAKRAVEQCLMYSGMPYTILQPTCFMEVWLSPALGFDAANAKAQIYGSGTNRISWTWIDGFVECWKFFRDGGNENLLSTFFSQVSSLVI